MWTNIKAGKQQEQKKASWKDVVPAVVLLFQVLGRPRSIIWLRPTTLPSCFQPKHPPSCRLSRPRYHIHVSSGRCGKSRLNAGRGCWLWGYSGGKKKKPKKQKNGVMTNWSEHGRTKPCAARRHVSLVLLLFSFEDKTSIVPAVSESCSFPPWNSGVVTRIWKISPQPESTQCWVENGFWVNYCFEI